MGLSKIESDNNNIRTKPLEIQLRESIEAGMANSPFKRGSIAKCSRSLNFNSGVVYTSMGCLSLDQFEPEYPNGFPGNEEPSRDFTDYLMVMDIIDS